VDRSYRGALLFNICAFTLPAIYGTLSKLWIAKIDSSMVSTAETYVYIGVAVEVINEGLPRAAYKVIGDKSRRTRGERIGISNAMILFQVALGALMSIVICAAAKAFTQSFVPGEVKAESERYVRIGAFSAVFSALDMAVSTATRSLDRYVPQLPTY
jgi:Na+-driven multidrug efflux pump